jgi:hypothetical protein
MTKNICIALCLCFAFTTLFVASCSKESQKSDNKITSEQGDDWLNAPKITLFSDLKSEVKVVNGNLHFKSSIDLKNVINFLRNAKKEEIVKWENSFSDFTSVHKFLDMAKTEFRQDTLNKNKFNELKNKYEGKVTFIDKGQRLKQIISNGSIYGRIIGLNGEYRVGKSIVFYYKGKVISIADGDESKLQEAKNSLQENSKAGIFVHNLRAEDDIKDLNVRGTRVHWNWNCVGVQNCPAYTYRSAEGDVGNQHFWLTQEYDIYNNSWFEGNTNSQGNVVWDAVVDVSAHIDIEHRRLRWWGGYSPTFGGFNWGIGWGLDMEFRIDGNIVAAPFSSTNTPGHQGGGWGWFVNNSDLEVDITFWNRAFTEVRSSNVSSVFSFISCIRRTGLVSSSNNDPVNIKNSQYCQDGVTTE